MPPLEKHNLQYKKNKNHLNDLLITNTPPYDWIVTVSFYCAVHLVEKELAKHNKHPTDHKQRFKEIGERVTLDSLAIPYQALYNESRTSRYKCQNINAKKASEAVGILEKIEIELA